VVAGVVAGVVSCMAVVWWCGGGVVVWARVVALVCGGEHSLSGNQSPHKGGKECRKGETVRDGRIRKKGFERVAHIGGGGVVACGRVVACAGVCWRVALDATQTPTDRAKSHRGARKSASRAPQMISGRATSQAVSSSVVVAFYMACGVVVAVVWCAFFARLKLPRYRR
jgi:hypothetical protein